ncbi:competence protein, partial [Streptococcus suis]|uniref:competence protein n=2 Tax=Streptococcus TaxID=1301 RepID=UPI000CF3D568
FEELYKDSQRLAVNSQQEIHLQLTDSQLSNGHQSVQVPASIDVLTEQAIVFDKKGGNSSLAKLSFGARGKTVSYQLYIGSGRYKKSEK